MKKKQHNCEECHRAGYIKYDCCDGFQDKATDIACRANAALLAPTLEEAMRIIGEKPRTSE